MLSAYCSALGESWFQCRSGGGHPFAPRAKPELVCPREPRAGSPLPGGRVDLNAEVSGYSHSGFAIAGPWAFFQLSRNHFAMCGVKGSSNPVCWAEEAYLRRIPAVFSLVVFTLTLTAQPPARPAAKSKPAATVTGAATMVSTPAVLKNSPLDLPVRKVVLYKNGVGYFEHAGTVNGNQRVAIDFTSSQLNDVLQSLRVLEGGGGGVGGGHK